MKTAMKITVKGNVQGMFLNQFVKENADKLNLKGYLRNFPEGKVEILVEGEEKNVERFLEIIKKGPKHSQIRNVETDKKRWEGEFKEFKILKF